MARSPGRPNVRAAIPHAGRHGPMLRRPPTPSMSRGARLENPLVGGPAPCGPAPRGSTGGGEPGPAATARAPRASEERQVIQRPDPPDGPADDRRPGNGTKDAAVAGIVPV